MFCYGEYWMHEAHTHVLGQSINVNYNNTLNAKRTPFNFLNNSHFFKKSITDT